MNKMMTVEVVYASKQKQQSIIFQIEEGVSLKETILRSGILTLFPEIDLSKQKIGVFSQKRLPQDIAHDGDRIEIYRPLLLDPKERRRLKAKK